MSIQDAKARQTASLQTPTDLSPDAVRDLSGALNILLADMFGLYLKIKNFHWHMSGPHFRDFHLLLDEHGDQVFAATKVVADQFGSRLGALVEQGGEARGQSADRRAG